LNLPGWEKLEVKNLGKKTEPKKKGGRIKGSSRQWPRKVRGSGLVPR